MQSFSNRQFDWNCGYTQVPRGNFGNCVKFIYNNYESRTGYNIENLEHKRIIEKCFEADGRMFTENTKSLILPSEVEEYFIENSWFI